MFDTFASELAGVTSLRAIRRHSPAGDADGNLHGSLVQTGDRLELTLELRDGGDEHVLLSVREVSPPEPQAEWFEAQARAVAARMTPALWARVVPHVGPEVRVESRTVWWPLLPFIGGVAALIAGIVCAAYSPHAGEQAGPLRDTGTGLMLGGGLVAGGWILVMVGSFARTVAHTMTTE
jgi:hypothetical protein